MNSAKHAHGPSQPYRRNHTCTVCRNAERGEVLETSDVVGNEVNPASPSGSCSTATGALTAWQPGMDTEPNTAPGV